MSKPWLCVNPECSATLGDIRGPELYPSVPGENIHTSGVNLSIRCPACGRVKIFYCADPVVRAVYQLVDAIAEVSAEAMVRQIAESMRNSAQPH